MRSYTATALTITALTLGLTHIPSTARAFCFQEAAARYNVAPELVWSISKHESGLNPAAINWNTDGSYDFGLMQINSIHADDLRKAGIAWESLADPCTNVMVGTWLLSQRIREYGYTWKAIGAYHSKTPSKRDRYAQSIAKLLSTINAKTPVASQHQTNNMQTLVWGQTHNGTSDR